MLYLDFEFNRVLDEKVNLVCCCTLDSDTGEKRKWWLHNSKSEKEKLKDFLRGYNVVVGYSTIAEARSYYSLGISPREFNWIDLFLEYRLITNHNDDLMYGNQLVDGEVRKVKKPKPKWERTEQDEENGFKPTHSLVEATYKLLKIIRDSDHKDEMRELIISDPVEFSQEERESILEYCMDDVVLLPALHKEIIKKLKELDSELGEAEMLKHMYWRGRFSANTAIMESKGYPIYFDQTKNFSKQVPSILYDCQKDINGLFPEISPFKWDRILGRFKWDQKATREWIRNTQNVARWTKTDKKDISLSLEAFTKVFDFKHDYPRDSFGAQMVRYLKLQQTVYGFRPSSGGRKTFWDYVGKDQRVRPYTNGYGAQSSRSQPSSTGFMFLKPAWMRSLVGPGPGKFMAGIDYGSQEFLIAAIKSADKNMIDAYLSGDVYLAFGKQSGKIPKSATKETHKADRDQFKECVLGMSYLMTEIGLAISLTNKTGKVWTEAQAKVLIELFNSTYKDYEEYRRWVLEYYRQDGYIKLEDGWYMWGDNDNFRSIANCPVQGFGACVMRKALDMAMDRGLYIPFTLHDALYLEGNIGEEHQIEELKDVMREAFAFYFDRPEDKEIARKIKLDGYAWSPDYSEEGGKFDFNGWKCDFGRIYMDERAENDYKAFSKYFNPVAGDLL